jgi:negative regulator of flagellin synthesis FlgM
MKIHDVGGHGGPRRTDETTSATKRADLAPSTPVEGDRLELSEAARKRVALIEATKDVPDLRQERIEELRRALDSGSYEVDVRRLARAILEFEDGIPH